MSVDHEIAIVHRESILSEALATVVARALPHCRLQRFVDLQGLYRYARQVVPPLILIEDSSAGQDALNLFDIRRNLHGAKLMLVGDRLDRRRVVTALVDGASGYVSHDMDAQQIAQAVAQVSMGETYIPILPEFSKNNAGSGPSSAAKGHAIHLTTRQHEVMALLQLGKSNKEIARNLAISEATVKVHVAAIFQALHVHNRLSAVMRLQCASHLITNVSAA